MKGSFQILPEVTFYEALSFYEFCAILSVVVIRSDNWFPIGPRMRLSWFLN